MGDDVDGGKTSLLSRLDAAKIRMESPPPYAVADVPVDFDVATALVTMVQMAIDRKGKRGYPVPVTDQRLSHMKIATDYVGLCALGMGEIANPFGDEEI